MPDLSIPPRHDRPGARRGAPGRIISAALALALLAGAARGGEGSPAPAPGAAGISPAASEPISGLLRVPLDHDQPDGPSIELYYELGAAFDRALPTVLVVGDGQ